MFIYFFSGLQQEVELLEAIYMDELVVGHDQR